MKTKSKTNEKLRKHLGELIADLDNAYNSAWMVMHEARVQWQKGTQYLHLIKAIDKVRDRSKRLLAKLADK